MPLHKAQKQFMQQSWLKILGKPFGKSQAEKLAKDLVHQDELCKIVLNLCFYQNQQIAFRAAWVLENLFTIDPDYFAEHLFAFLDCYAQQNNLSARRHFAKILALVSDKKAPMACAKLLKTYDTEVLVETNFTWLIDDAVPVAVKSHCLSILANLSNRHPWVREELLATMNHLLDKESIAFFAKVKQIRKQLRIK